MSSMFSASFAGSRKGFDSGLREYMLKIYNFMAMALAISGVTAYGFMSVPELTSLIFSMNPNGMITGYTGLGLLVAFAPIGIALYFFWGMGSMNIQTAQMLFWAYASLTGASLSSLGFMYTGASIAKTFFVTAASFGAMSIYGYTTKRDLTSMGSFLVMGLIGVIIASIANLFMMSPAVDFAISILGVFIFMGLTAYDTQRLKEVYYSVGGGEQGQKMAVVGAFTLYLDFINLFLYLIKFMGVRREN
jgi:FtsH-binding integral membrane protein